MSRSPSGSSEREREREETGDVGEGLQTWTPDLQYILAQGKTFDP